ncbi:hypothetical protein HAV15_007529 [Penicillium sp. str. |nr:hypothetical protein HAV15_007529 [Penicillium sp. str. \
MAPIVGYQILYGIGTDLSVQVPIVVAGGLSSTKDQSVPTATVLCVSIVRMSSLSGQEGLKMAFCMEIRIALFGVSFLCALIPKRGGKVPRLGEDGGKDDQGNLVPMAYIVGLNSAWLAV